MSKATITLKAAVAQFLVYLGKAGKSTSTITTTQRSLDLLINKLGADKVVAKTMPVHISAFFKSDEALTRNDKPRAEASIKQIRRIVRQFLIWCVEKGYLDKAPLPKDEVERGGGVRPPAEEENTEDNSQTEPSEPTE